MRHSDGRELFFSSFRQANRWWLHLYRLLTGEWSNEVQASNPLQQQQSNAAAASGSSTTGDNRLATPQNFPGPLFKSPDWPSATGFFPDWLWSGLLTDVESRTRGGEGVAGGGVDSASLEHARGDGGC